jgi:hypothetical protein
MLARAAVPPSALPGISPSRGEITRGTVLPAMYVASADKMPTIPHNAKRWALGRPQPISPLEGEMAGRPEGGVSIKHTEELDQ